MKKFKPLKEKDQTIDKKHIKKVKYSLVIIVVAFLAIGWYLADAYPAQEEAKALLNNSSNIHYQGQNVVVSSKTGGTTGLIFYPGAKVEYTAYLPLLQQLADQGITSVLIKMPFNMAIFNENAAAEVFEKMPEIKTWYIGGHSMGGAMASSYAAKHPDKVEGVVLLGAYLYGDYPPEKTLVIYGSFNESVEEKIQGGEQVIEIEGGNHAQFGNYGKQRGDHEATISAQEQQREAITAIIDFIE